MIKHLKKLARLLRSRKRYSPAFDRVLETVPRFCQGQLFTRGYEECSKDRANVSEIAPNPLREYFQNYTNGPGIWKCDHYFDIYHRHFARFIGKSVNVLEIGVYSGGSLGMWRSYFGDQCHIYGVDIEEACRTYEDEHTSIFIGDQEDPEFWKSFKEKVDRIDILIDDGGHTTGQQQVTLEQMLPFLAPGGIFLCEDVMGLHNKFNSFAASLADELHKVEGVDGEPTKSRVSSFQSWIESIHYYPYVVVLEKRRQRIEELTSKKRGTEWQPFL